MGTRDEAAERPSRATLLPSDYFAVHARRETARDAIVFEGRRWTYAALDDAADRFVGLLRTRGIGPGERVAFLGRNSALYFVALTGTLRAGAVFVPINWRNSPAETGYILADSGSRLVLTDQDFLESAEQASGGRYPIMVVDGAGPDDLPALLAATAPAGRIVLDPDAAGFQFYTSGTTGQPKGVLTSQSKLGVQRDIEVASGAFADWDDEEVVLSALPGFHIGGLSWAMTGFARGQTVVLSNDASPAALVTLAAACGATRIFIVPALLRGMLDEMDGRGTGLPHLRGVHYGAAPMDAALLARAIAALGCRFLQNYGMTEATGTIAMLPPADHDLARPGLLRSVGRALPGCALAIRDAEGRPVRSGEAGEIWVRAPGVMIGYANRPEATAQALIDGWYRTGDGGMIDAEGFLYLTDRIKDMIVSGGENVYPAEVEAALRRHPAVQDCAVFGLPHPRWGEGVTAAVELRPGTSLAAGDLIAFARDLLAGYKIPRRIEFDLVLPRTASGKVQRGRLREMMIERDGGPA